MIKSFLISAILSSSLSGTIAMAEDPLLDMDAYMAGCRKGLSQSRTNFDAKDIEMLCSDPYLQGKPNESAADKSRRLRLINKTNEDKERMLSNWSKSKDDIKPCFDAYLAIDPGKDLKDLKMLCINPYLTPTANESDEDHNRRLRLIKESEADRDKMLEKHLPKGTATKKAGKVIR